jgi:hypothetical protein
LDVKELNLKKLKPALGGWARHSNGRAQSHWQQAPPRTGQRRSLHASVNRRGIAKGLLFLSRKLQKLDLKMLNSAGASFGWLQAGYCLEIALIGDSILLIWLLTFLSTKMQSLEPSIQGSTELGLTKFDFYLSFRLQVQTPRFYVPTIFWLSNLVAMFPRASGILMGSSLHAFSHSYAS